MRHKHIFVTLLVVLFSLVATLPAHAQCEIQSIRYLGAVEMSAAYSVEVAGSYAYVAARDGLKVVDISDAMSPQIVGSAAADFGTSIDVLKLVLSGSYAYVCTAPAQNLYVFNISDPLHPSLAATVNDIGVLGMDISGSYLYCVCGSTLTVIDISNPSVPVIVSTTSVTGEREGWGAVDIKVVDSYAYVANGSCISIFDISNPPDPVQIEDTPTLYHPVGLAVQGCNLFVMTWSGLEIYDITVPTAPARIGSLNSGFGYSIKVKDHYVYMGLLIVDISDPSKPFVTDISLAEAPLSESYNDPYIEAHDIAFSGGFGFVAFASEPEGVGKLQVIDPSTPYMLPKLHELDLSGADSVAVEGNYAYVTTSDGFDAIDFSDMAAPQVVGSLPLASSPRDVKVSGSHAFIAGDSFDVVDISDPTNPSLTATLNVWGNDLALSGNLAFVAAGYLKIIDITDPASPFLVSTYLNPIAVMGVAASGHYAYVADWLGLEIVDVSDPAAPVPVGSAASPYPYACTTRVAVSGNYAYLVDNNPDGGLVILDVSDPTAPVVVGNADGLHLPIIDVAVSDAYAYLTTRSLSPLLVYDMENPAAPVLAAKYDDLYRFSRPSQGGIAISNSLAFLARDTLDIIQVCPTSGGTPAISTFPPALSFTTEQGTSVSDTIEVWNSGAGALSYFVNSSTNSGFQWNSYPYSFGWIEIHPIAGGSAGEHDSIEFTVRTNFLPPGEHTANIVISDPRASNNPQLIPLTLTLLPVYHTLATNASPSEGGSVSGGGTYTLEQWATITAVPNPGWKFDHWEGDYSGRTQNPMNLLMNADKNTTAVFVPLLSNIGLSAPSSGVLLSSAPTFTWTCDGGANNAFAVELSYSPAFTNYWSLYENSHQVVYGTSWTMPRSIWRQVQKNRQVYWRVRGADLEREPRTIITSGQTWWFQKN